MITHQNISGGGDSGGLVNTLINKLPVELHIPGYNYCGPGTKLNLRLARGDKGVNPLDEACKLHDIAYSNSKYLENRHKADKILANKAIQRFHSKDATFGEKISALGVSTAMKAKVKLGAGCKNQIKKKRKVKCLSFKLCIKHIGRSLNKNNSLNKNILLAVKYFKKLKKNKLRIPRIVAIPKKGGVLPLIPIFAGLSALGSLAGGTASIVKAINDSKAAKDQLEEKKRHNKAIESIAVGEGLYLQKYKQGLGLYLTQPKLVKKNFQ